MTLSRPTWLSDRARQHLADCSVGSRLWSALASLTRSPAKRRPLEQADLVEGWDELDYRAEGFEPFVGVGNVRVLLREGDHATTVVLLEDDRAVHVLNEVAAPSLGEAVLALAWLAAATDDGRVDESEERALLALRLALGVDDRVVASVKNRVAFAVIERSSRDELGEGSGLDLAACMAETLELRPDTRAALLAAGMGADAAALARRPALDDASLESWRNASRTRGLTATAVEACERRLRRAHSIHQARAGNLTVLSSATLRLTEGELLHWTGPVVVYRVEPGREAPPPPPTPLEPLVMPTRLTDEPGGVLRRMGSGALHVTTFRLIWTGPRGVADAPVTDVTEIQPYRLGLVLRGTGPFADRFIETAGADGLHVVIDGLLHVHRNAADEVRPRPLRDGQR